MGAHLRAQGLKAGRRQCRSQHDGLFHVQAGDRAGHAEPERHSG